MRLILVPHTAGTRDANIWLCANDVTSAPADFNLTIEKVGDVTVRQDEWKPVEVGSLKAQDTQAFIQVKKIENLTPHTRYNLVAARARASFSTLPEDVPREGERPFSILVASCFYVGNDRAPMIGAAIDGLPPDLKPDFKILCGDQVYLDVPEITFLPLAENALSRSFLSKYLRNWNDETGYQVLLKNSATYFTADDHEFWNNHPNRAIHIPNTWTESGRQRLAERALRLFTAFQSDDEAKVGRVRKIDVGPLSIRIVDSRIFRKPGDDEFMKPEDLSEVVDWVQTLSGPGVLVIGQPLFDEPVGAFSRRYVDRVLPNYKQYQQLVTAISKASSSLVVLTGDVHYSRVANATFRSATGAAEITEIITSPTAVVAGAPGTPTRPPDRFPGSAFSGMTSAPTKLQLSGSAENNFAVMQFTQRNGQINMRVQHFYIPSRSIGSSSLTPIQVPQPGGIVNIPLFFKNQAS